MSNKNPNGPTASGYIVPIVILIVCFLFVRGCVQGCRSTGGHDRYDTQYIPQDRYGSGYGYEEEYSPAPTYSAPTPSQRTFTSQPTNRSVNENLGLDRYGNRPSGNTSASCTQCGGTGRSKLACNFCQGTGLSSRGTGASGAVASACNMCGGTRFRECTTCRGSGSR